MFDRFFNRIIMGLITIKSVVFAKLAHSILPGHEPAFRIVFISRGREGFTKSFLEHGS